MAAAAGPPAAGGRQRVRLRRQQLPRVLEEHDAGEAGPDWDGDVQIVALSGDTPADQSRQLAEWPADRPWAEVCDRRAAARGRSSEPPPPTAGSCSSPQRDRRPRQAVADAQAEAGSRPGRPVVALPDGAYFGRGPAPGRLGVLFPGQGSQYVGMLRDLACLFPRVLDASPADRASAEVTAPTRLIDLIYPHPAFTPDGRRRQEDGAAGDRRRPAGPRGGEPRGVAGAAALRRDGRRLRRAQLRRAGRPVCRRGVRRRPTCTGCRRVRGRLMARAGGDDAGRHARGARPARRTSRPTCCARSSSTSSWPTGTPRARRASGATAEIARARGGVRSAPSCGSTRLPVAAAFHSPLVAAGAAGRSGPALEAVRVPTPAGPGLRQHDGPRVSGRPARRPRPAGRPARPAGRVRRPDREHGRGRRADVRRGRARARS